MITHYDPDTSILTATCSPKELHCIHAASLPLNNERAAKGRVLLARLEHLKEERENIGDYVEVHVGLANVPALAQSGGEKTKPKESNL